MFVAAFSIACSSETVVFSPARRASRKLLERIYEFVTLTGFADCIMVTDTIRTRVICACGYSCVRSQEYNQEQLRVKSLDGGTSLVRSFPSRVAVRCANRTDPRSAVGRQPVAPVWNDGQKQQGAARRVQGVEVCYEWHHTNPPDEPVDSCGGPRTTRAVCATGTSACPRRSGKRASTRTARAVGCCAPAATANARGRSTYAQPTHEVPMPSGMSAGSRVWRGYFRSSSRTTFSMTSFTRSSG